MTKVPGRLAGLLAALYLAGCSTVVMVPRMKPAEVNLAGYQRIAVGGVGGQGGEALTTELTQGLFNTKRFEVLDRQHLDQIMKEQDFSASGSISDDSAISIGQMIGSAALLVGDVTGQTYNEDVTSNATTCTRDGKQVPCTHYTRVANAQLSVSLKVVDTTTGKILAVKNLSARRSNQQMMTDKSPPRMNLEHQWFGECRKEIAAEFMKVVAPYEVRVRVKLLDDGDLPELEVGNNYAKLGKWNDAAAQYTAALSKADSNPDIGMDVRAKAHYNLGVALGYSGSYDSGIAEIERAYALDPDDDYIKQINAIKTFKSDDERLAEQAAGADENNM